MINVLKFGGTSVGSSENMQRVASVVKRENARVTVLSAMSGTTDALVKISSLANQCKMAEISEVVRMLTDKYTNCVKGLFPQGVSDELMQKIADTMALIIHESVSFKGYTSERLILSQGELLTSFIFSRYLASTGVKVKLLNAPDFMLTDKDGKVDTALLKDKLEGVSEDRESTFYITQGFICTNYRGEIDNLGRGGSDYSAALIGAAIGADEVQIWTDIDGMHNNDPRFVEHTFPIRQMSFDEAAELAYFGAKILHPATIQPCKDLHIPVLLKNTMDPEAYGTRISDENDNGHDFHAVAAKDGITVIRIYSARMLMAYGFLRQVFEIFEKYRTPIDMITTSEVAVSLTIDNTTHIDEIEAELKELGTIEVETDNSIVCIVGCMEHKQSGMAAKIMDSLKAVPLKMISYGASHHSVALLISTENKKQTLQCLNDNLFFNNQK